MLLSAVKEDLNLTFVCNVKVGLFVFQFFVDDEERCETFLMKIIRCFGGQREEHSCPRP